MSTITPEKRVAIQAKQREVNMQRWTKHYKMLQKDSESWAEIRLLSYLEAYGDTEESDLVACGVNRLNKSPEDVRRILNEMSDKGPITKVIHKELEPQKAYFAINPNLDWELHVLIGIDSEGKSERYRQLIEREIADHKPDLRARSR